MKKLKIFLIIILITVTAFSIFCIWQRDNIKSVYYSAKYDDDKIDELISEHNRDVEEYIKEHSNLNVRPSAPVEEKLHQSGLITDSEFADILTGRTDVKTIFGTDVKLNEKKKFVDESGKTLNVEDLRLVKQNRNLHNATETENAQTKNVNVADGEKGTKDQTTTIASEKNNGVHSSKSTKTNELNHYEKASGTGKGDKTHAEGNVSGETGNINSPEGKNSVEDRPGVQTEKGNAATGTGKTASDYIAQLYVLKSSYLSQIDGIISSAYAAYTQMSSEEKKNAKSSLMNYYYDAVGLEQQCDGAVEGVISQLTAELTATGGDLSIVDKVRSAYSSEKSLIKAQYINKLK